MEGIVMGVDGARGERGVLRKIYVMWEKMESYMLQRNGRSVERCDMR